MEQVGQHIKQDYYHENDKADRHSYLKLDSIHVRSINVAIIIRERLMNNFYRFIAIALIVFVVGWLGGCSVHIKDDSVPDVKLITENGDTCE